jgi:2-dehydro-3-deoxy-D-arabinonate dehydratase
MNTYFLAKIFLNNTESLILTDGIKYSLVKNYFSQVDTFSNFIENVDPDNLQIALTDTLPTESYFLSLIEDQSIFATGCTYEWSSDKLNSTAENDPYKKVYLSERPMFFYKGTLTNMASHNENIGIRRGSKTTIPEGEIVAVFNKTGKIIGHTIGNDVTAVDIEKENPLFQMQAKFYKGSVSILPLIKLGSKLPMTQINCKVIRDNICISETSYETKNFNRDSQKIANELHTLGLTNNGGFLFLGCGVSYPKDKALIPNDTVIIQSSFLPLSLHNSCAYI